MDKQDNWLVVCIYTDDRGIEFVKAYKIFSSDMDDYKRKMITYLNTAGYHPTIYQISANLTIAE